jgi:hypothetical protein
MIVPKANVTIASQLAAANLLIENTLSNEDILEQVATRGYPVDVLTEGQRLHRLASKAVDAQAAAAGAARLATERARLAEQEARDVYMALAQTVRAVFPSNSSQRKALDMTKPTASDATAFLAAAITLFNNAQNISEISVVLSRYGYDAPALERERELIIAYQQALQAQTRAKGAAKRATQAQTEALAVLQQWTTQYRRIAKIVLRKQPDLLKGLGLTPQQPRSVPTRSTKPQTQAV